MSSTTKKTIDLKRSLVDAILAGLVALIVFGPIVGVVLDGYGFNLETTRVAWIVAIVMAGRFALSLFLQTPKGLKILEGFESTGSGVHVLPPDYKSRLRWIIPLVILVAVVFPFFSNSYLLGVVILGLIYVLLGLGLNIVVGLAGLLDLGYVGVLRRRCLRPGAGLSIPRPGFLDGAAAGGYHRGPCRLHPRVPGAAIAR